MSKVILKIIFIAFIVFGFSLNAENFNFSDPNEVTYEKIIPLKNRKKIKKCSQKNGKLILIMQIFQAV